METFTIKINGVPIDVVRNGAYVITYVPEKSTTKKEIKKTGIVIGMSLNLQFIKLLLVDKVEFSIPIKEITTIEQV